MALSTELDVTPAISEQVLLSLGNFKEPIAFEIFADSNAISIQSACNPDFAPYLKSQWKALFPAVSVAERNGFLATQFNGSQPTVVADFGLSGSSILPLRLFRSFTTDPLAGLINSFITLGQAEKAVFQVLFQPVKAAWVDELRKIQTDANHRKLLQDQNPNFSASLRDKLSSPLFAVTVRLMAQAPGVQRAWELVRQIGGNLRQYSDPTGNELIALSNEGYSEHDHRLSFMSRTSYRSGMLLNTSELASLTHLPSSSVRLDKLNRTASTSKAVPSMAIGNRLVLGENKHDGQMRNATLSNDQRTRHIHIIGSTGSGKSTLLLDLIRQDIEAGEGVCVIDPHGDLIDAVCAKIPENRVGDVILFDPSDSQYPIGFNIFQAHSDLEKTLISSDLVAAFKRMATSWGDVMDAVLANAVLAILESDRGGTLLDLKRFLVEKDFRNEFLQSVLDETVRYFWLNEFPLIAGKPQASILIRLDAFLRQKLIRNIVCQKENKLNFREIMDHKKILLIKLSQGTIGLENSYLLGTLLVTKLHQIALSRQETTNRPFFAIYIDEFHNFVVPSIEGILSGIRKYNIALALSHQEFRQLQSRSQEVAASVMSNCYTRVCFRLGDADAERFANGFSRFDASALQNLGVGEAVARIERADYDFNLKTLDVSKVDAVVLEQRRTQIIDSSRQRYAVARQQIETGMYDLRSPVAVVNAPPPETNPDVVAAVVDEPDRTRREASAESTGSSEHQYLQSIIKRVGENYDYVSTIEKEVFGGAGRVDVALENDHHKIACEVAVTNTVAYETENIKKCLSSGFDKVVVISTNTKHLNKIRRSSESVLTADQSSKVHFLEPENFHLFLDSLRSDSPSSVTVEPLRVKGYKVESTFGTLQEQQVETVRQNIADVLSNASKLRGEVRNG